MTEYLVDRHCVHVEQGSAPLAADAAHALLAKVHGDWNIAVGNDSIRREFRFHDFHETMAFVNALAWLVHREDHHPNLDIGYNHCTVHFSTHAASGLTENDFICAAKIDALLNRTD